MKNILKIIVFCIFLSAKLILSAAENTKKKIEIKYRSIGNSKPNFDLADERTILSNPIEKNFSIKIKEDHSIKNLQCNSLELLNQILNTNLIKRKNEVNHNWNRENLSRALNRCPNIQAIKRSVFLINYFNKDHNNENNQFPKTIESCSYFLDKLSRDLAKLNDSFNNLTNSDIDQSANKLYTNIQIEVNKPNTPWYIKYPFFGYYWIKFILFSQPLKRFILSKFSEVKGFIFKKQATNNPYEY